MGEKASTFTIMLVFAANFSVHGHTAQLRGVGWSSTRGGLRGGSPPPIRDWSEGSIGAWELGFKQLGLGCRRRKVDIRPNGKVNSISHGARPIHSSHLARWWMVLHAGRLARWFTTPDVRAKVWSSRFRLLQRYSYFIAERPPCTSRRMCCLTHCARLFHWLHPVS